MFSIVASLSLLLWYVDCHCYQCLYQVVSGRGKILEAVCATQTTWACCTGPNRLQPHGFIQLCVVRAAMAHSLTQYDGTEVQIVSSACKPRDNHGQLHFPGLHTEVAPKKPRANEFGHIT